MPHNISRFPFTFSSSGLHPLLSEEATIRDQVKAAKAAEFDHKVQAGLEDIEPEPDAAEIKTAAPSAPTAAKARHFSLCSRLLFLED